MARKPGGVISFDLECSWCAQPIPEEHSAYKVYSTYAKSKESGHVFCSKSCGLKARHANLSPKQKRSYHDKIATTRKSRSPKEKLDSKKKLQQTRASFSEEKLEDITTRTRETSLKNGSYEKAAETRDTTLRDRYGDNYGKVRYKVYEETMLAEYGVRNALVKGSKFREQATNTNIELYGVEIATENPEIAAKVVATYTERHGGMGRASPSANKSYKQTMLEEYDVENPMHVPAIAKRAREQYKKVGKYKAAETKKRNGTTPKEVAWKGHETKKRNGSYNSSKQEFYILGRLRSLLGKQVIHLYRDHPDYPWEADFYDPRTGTIYEYQGYFTHGKEPYDAKNKEHRRTVRELKAKTDKWASKLHIEIWTNDSLKRRTAAKNSVPFVEWFSLTEFEEWLCTKIKKLLGAVKVRDNCFKLKNGTYAAHNTSSYAGTDKRVVVFYSDTPLRKLAKSLKKGVK